jgi:predicted Fe-Mo cluster-binding NifX family protein
MKKIALPITKDNKIDDHFGHCEFYGIYTISDENTITDVQTLKSEQGCGCKSNIASVLSQNGVSIMLAGGIGNGAINVLNHNGIDVIRGCSGYAENLVKQYINGEITDSGSSCSAHENHHENGHNCSH